MILNYLNRPTVLVIAAIVMIFALMFHNVFQTWVASRLGDNSPRFAGFGRFDPQQQLEPIGVLFLVLLGFGWPTSVAINGRNYSGRREALAWYAGPLAYLIVAFGTMIVAAVFRALAQPELFFAFQVAAQLAILHAVINLFPVFPLDGARAALAWGNRDVKRVIQQVANYGILGFLVVFLVLQFTGVIGALLRLIGGTLQAIVNLIPGL